MVRPGTEVAHREEKVECGEEDGEAKIESGEDVFYDRSGQLVLFGPHPHRSDMSRCALTVVEDDTNGAGHPYRDDC